MPLDAVFLTALARELKTSLLGAKIDKVQMPGRDTVLLGLRGAGENLRLLMSAGSGARIHLTTASFENPAVPPMLCMLLRKHLTGARITGLTQPFMERLLILELDAPDELGHMTKKRLVLELMGRAKNILLVDDGGVIIDCLRRAGPEKNEARPILPGLQYRLPPAQDRPCLFSTDADTRRAAVLAAPQDTAWERWLVDSFSGLSPLLARELCVRALGDAAPRGDLATGGRETLLREVEGLCVLVAAEDFRPVMLLVDGQPRDYCFMPITQYGAAASLELSAGFSELLDAFHTRRDQADGIRRRAQELTRTAKTARDRLSRKLDMQERELRETAKREEHRRRGDLITANIYQLQKGMTACTVPDYFEEGSPEVTLPLDPLKTPQQNAAACYKVYVKARTAEEILTRELARARLELQYLESFLDQLARAESERDLAELRRELTASGYLRAPAERKRVKTPPSKPLRYRSEAGLVILVGRTNLQNDELTLRTARRSDIWLHTQKIHGSHVIVLCEEGEPDETTLTQAASLAAYHSQGRDAGKLAVDYTQVRHVRKPAGAKPGMVVYSDYKTLIAEPDAALAARLAE